MASAAGRVDTAHSTGACRASAEAAAGREAAAAELRDGPGERSEREQTALKTGRSRLCLKTWKTLSLITTAIEIPGKVGGGYGLSVTT